MTDDETTMQIQSGSGKSGLVVNSLMGGLAPEFSGAMLGQTTVTVTQEIDCSQHVDQYTPDQLRKIADIQERGGEMPGAVFFSASPEMPEVRTVVKCAPNQY